jgi:hypothetical protein
MNLMNNLAIKRIGVNMQVVYIVKSFGPENGYLNLKAFADIEDAEAYRAVVAKQIPDGVEDEWVEIEDMMVDYG